MTKWFFDLVPDWAEWRRERLPELTNVPFMTLAPDWACEVISPTTGRIDRSRKMWCYAREGVAHLWLVDPLLCTLEVRRLEGECWIVVGTHAGEEIVRVEPFEAIALSLGRWWLRNSP